MSDKKNKRKRLIELRPKKGMFSSWFGPEPIIEPKKKGGKK